VEGLQEPVTAAEPSKEGKARQGEDAADAGEVPEGRDFPPGFPEACDAELPVLTAEAGTADGSVCLPEAVAAGKPADAPIPPGSSSSESAPSKSLPPVFFSGRVKDGAGEPASLSFAPAGKEGQTPGTFQAEETGQQQAVAAETSPEQDGGPEVLRPGEGLTEAKKGSLRDEGKSGTASSASSSSEADTPGKAAARASILTAEDKPLTAGSSATAGRSGPEGNGRIPERTGGTDAGDTAGAKENPSVTASGRTEDGKAKTEPASVRDGGPTMEPKKFQETAADGLETESARRSRPAASSLEITAVKVDSPPAGAAGKQGATAAQPVNRQELVETVIGMRQTLGKNSGKVTLTLEPPSLGALTLEVQVRDRRVETVLVADSFEVQQVLKGGLEHLRSALQEQGLKVDTIQVLWQGAPSDSGTGGSASHSFSHFFREQTGSQGGTGNWPSGGKEESSSGGTGTPPTIYEKGRGEGISIFA
jgi:hypothetical protein